MSTQLTVGRAVRGITPGPVPRARGGARGGSVRQALAWGVLAVVAGWLSVPGLGWGTAAAIGAVATGGVLQLSGSGIAGAAIVVAVFGAGATARILDRPVSWGLLVAGLALAVAAQRLTGAAGRLSGESARRIGTALCLGAVAVRILPVVWGRGASGLISVAGVGLRLGEFTRPLFLAGMALLLAVPAGRSFLSEGALARAGALLALAVTTLAMEADLGPAVLLVAAGWAALARAHGGRSAVVLPLLCLVPGSALVWTFLPGYARSRFADTWFAAAAPQGQAGVARSLLSEAALIGPGWSATGALHALAGAATDYVVLSVVVCAGYVIAGGLVVLLVGACVPAARRLASRTDVAGLLGTGALVLLCGQVAVSALGALGVGPLTGVPFPLLSSTGSSVLPAALVVGCVAGAARPWARPLTGRPQANGRLVTGLVAGTAALLVAGLLAAAVLGAGAAAPRSPLVTMAVARGALVTADGHVLAPATDAGIRARRYPDGARYLALGWVAPGSSYGLERTMAHELTCGRERGWLARLAAPVVASPCRPADVVTTLRDDVMRTVQPAADRAGDDATVVIADARSGGVLADYSSGLRRRRASNGEGVAAGGVDGVQGAPSRIEATAPGSLFKLITVAAATEDHVSGSLPNPASYLTPVGTAVRNEWGGVCPGDTVVDLLAYSCNTLAAELAEQMGPAALDLVARRQFGLGSDTVAGLTVTPSSSGLTASSDPDAVARAGFGQGGVRVTPLAMTQAVVQLLSGGRPRALTYVAGVRTGGSQLTPWRANTDAPAVSVPPGVAGVVLNGMRAAVAHGTAKRLAGVLPGHDLAAKTGSADGVRGGRAVTDSWVTVVVDRHIVVTVIVRGTRSDPDPASRSAALELARMLFVAGAVR